MRRQKTRTPLAREKKHKMRGTGKEGAEGEPSPQEKWPGRLPHSCHGWMRSCRHTAEVRFLVMTRIVVMTHELRPQDGGRIKFGGSDYPAPASAFWAFLGRPSSVALPHVLPGRAHCAPSDSEIGVAAPGSSIALAILVVPPWAAVARCALLIAWSDGHLVSQLQPVGADVRLGCRRRLGLSSVGLAVSTYFVGLLRLRCGAGLPASAALPPPPRDVHGPLSAPLVEGPLRHSAASVALPGSVLFYLCRLGRISRLHCTPAHQQASCEPASRTSTNHTGGIGWSSRDPH